MFKQVLFQLPWTLKVYNLDYLPWKLIIKQAINYLSQHKTKYLVKGV
uniref:Uncharacterized protein n=1 Tax=Rhizophora mucronata TaxID=61149 RepID=A0A2P2ISZ5_RHIMU